MRTIFTSLMALLLLSGCAGDPEPVPAGVVPVRMPDLPPELAKKAERLPDITDNTLGGAVQAEMQATVGFNDVSFKYNKLIDLYNCIQVAINEKKDPEQCLKK